jgi:hypothetical protein
MFKNLKTQFKITIFLIVLLVVAVALNVVWSSNSQRRQAEKEMLEKTQILDQEMRAVWDFIDINQARIDTDSNGEFNFKNIYCAIAGKTKNYFLLSSHCKPSSSKNIWYSSSKVNV